jgi:NIMA (never in mitosis gene a)-related kinase
MLRNGEEFDHHNGILRMYSAFESDGDLAIFLKHLKKKGEMLDEKVILSWFLMLVFGIQALHSKNVLHRDLKAANIFLTSKKLIKIGDFGISKVLDSTSAKTFVGTPYYLSPEVCSNKKYDLRSDLWSLGCILYELCTLNVPLQLFSTPFKPTTF